MPVLYWHPVDSKKRVVIDAGHGGKDPGAAGMKGTREKDLTLAIAKRIKATMAEELPEVEVIMTRDTDQFLKLKQRTEMATEASGYFHLHTYQREREPPGAEWKPTT